jgi:hypothetical protein
MLTTATRIPTCPYARAAALLELLARKDAIQRELAELGTKALRLLEEQEALEEEAARLRGR